MKLKLEGALSAIVTPFARGKVDEGALRALIDWQISEGVSGIVPTGSTGESATLTHEEHGRVVEMAVAQAKGRVPVVAGTGSNSTDEAVQLTRHAKDAGAQAALLIAPYYNKPTQEGLYRHYALIAEKVDLPLVLYNIPGRTAVNVLPETVARLSKIANVVGIKEATGSMDYTSELLSLVGGPEKFTVLSGDDSLTLPLMALGAKGTITAAANVIPAPMSRICAEAAKGNFEKARKTHYEVFPLIKLLFSETNPIPVKTALEIMGRSRAELRLPLCEMSQAGREKLEAEMRRLGIVR